MKALLKTTAIGLLLQTSVAKAESAFVQFSGRLDTYYSFNFNEPPPPKGLSTNSVSENAFPAGNNSYRYYDNFHNQPTLSLAEVSILMQKKDVSALVDLDFGAFADMNSMSPYPANTSVDESSKHIGQAVLTYRPEGKAYFIEAGKMYSHLGGETVKAADNFNYSRSLTFSYAMPFWASGVRFGYNFAPAKLQTSLYVYNGWNQVQDTNRSKTLGVQLRYSSSPNLSLIYNYIGGAERSDSESDLRQVHDFVMNYQATQNLFFLFEALKGREDGVTVAGNTVDANWLGVLLGSSYQWNESNQWAVRLESYNDDDGYTMGNGAQRLQSYVLTHTRQLDDGLKLRSEWRSDLSNEEVFTTKDGKSKSQNSLLVALLANF